MSVNYSAIIWNRNIKKYDWFLLIAVILFLAIFCGVALILFPLITFEILLIRAFGSAAFILLSFILAIGPLCRLNPRLLPLLYNRRHAGVLCFFLSAIHAILVILTYHFGGDINPILSIFVNSPFSQNGGNTTRDIFQIFGVCALFILFIMAITSHDFWLTNLTAPIWKSLHMFVYLAYALLILHISWGILQAETHPLLSLILFISMLTIISLHLYVTIINRKLDSAKEQNIAADGFVDCGDVMSIPENRARIVSLNGERVAIFRYDGKISAISNVCQHQNGPLGEGKVIKGCVTCPWHGYQYNPHDGASPPPFNEKIPTFNLQIKNGRVWIHPTPNPPGTYVEPAIINDN